MQFPFKVCASAFNFLVRWIRTCTHKEIGRCILSQIQKCFWSGLSFHAAFYLEISWWMFECLRKLILVSLWQQRSGTLTKDLCVVMKWTNTSTVYFPTMSSWVIHHVLRSLENRHVSNSIGWANLNYVITNQQLFVEEKRKMNEPLRTFVRILSFRDIIIIEYLIIWKTIWFR